MARGGVALAADLFQKGVECGDGPGVAGGEVEFLREIVAEIVELDG